MCLSDDTACHTTAACMARFGFLNFIRQDGDESTSLLIHCEQLESFKNVKPGKRLPFFFKFIYVFLPVDMQ